MISPFDRFREDHPEIGDRWQRCTSLWKPLEVPTHTVLLREGEVSTRAFFVEKGCLRVWFESRGRDLTFQFFFEEQIVSSAESYRRSVPSAFTIETLEPCRLWTLEKADFEATMVELQGIPSVMGHMVEVLFERQLHYMRHFKSFIRDTPEERYRRLVREQPELIQRVAQRYIASYLGITAVSLSRIRARI